MSHKEPRELLEAKELYKNGELEKALQLLDEFGEKGDITLYEQIEYYLLKTSIAERQHKRDLILEYSDKAYQLSQGQQNSLQLLDVIIKKARAYFWESNFEQALSFLTNGEELLKILSHESPHRLNKRVADIAQLKGRYHFSKNEFDKALEYTESALALRKSLDIKPEIFESLIQICSIYDYSGDINQAISYAEQSLTLAREIGDIMMIQICYISLGVNYINKGELVQGIEFHRQALAIAEKINDEYGVAASLNNLGIAYREQGDLEKAQYTLEKSLKLFKQAGSFGWTSLDNLFDIALDKGDLEAAQKYLNQLKNLKDETDFIKATYRVNKARLLRKSPRSLYRGKAEVMLKELVGEQHGYYIMKTVLLNLCDLLISELYSTGSLEIIEELEMYLGRLLKISKESHSYLIVAETNLLRARLGLLTLDLKKARRLLTEAQIIAEKYGLERLAMKISDDHDKLLKQSNTWENLKESETSIQERLDLSRLNEQMEKMLHKRGVDAPELIDEDPVAILIMDESGNPIFSQSFLEAFSLEDSIIGGFLSAFNSFSDELFSEGLDRATFGQYSIFMKSVQPFLICYLFKGQSYLAQQRVRFFIDKIKNDDIIWTIFNKHYQTEQYVQIKDIPTIEPLITDIFIEKNLPIY